MEARFYGYATAIALISLLIALTILVLPGQLIGLAREANSLALMQRMQQGVRYRFLFSLGI